MIAIKKSKYMDMSNIGPLENYLCRMPKPIRDKFGLNVGDSIRLSNANGNIVLKVGWVYENDEKSYPNFEGVFLSSHTFEQLAPLDSVSLKKITGLTLGADPEAYLINEATGNLVEASTQFNTGYIGHDFGLVEFRPDPKDSVQGLLLNLYTLIMMSQMYTKEGNYIHSASMYTFNPAGFHIHFGTNFVKEKDLKQFMKILACLLDFFVAVPAMYFERGDDWCRRVTSEYGTPGDIRKSTYSFEYRTLGGHVLADPRITGFILILAYEIVTDMYNIYAENNHVISSYYKIQAAYPTLPSREIVKEMLTSKYGAEYAHKYIDAILASINSFSNSNIVSIFNNIKDIKYNPRLVNNWGFNTKFALDMLRRYSSNENN